jgi:hypothetical protein
MHALAANIVWDRDATEGSGALALALAASSVLDHLAHIVTPSAAIRGARARVRKECESMSPDRSAWDQLVSDSLVELGGKRQGRGSEASSDGNGSGRSCGEADATAAAVQVPYSARSILTS